MLTFVPMMADTPPKTRTMERRVDVISMRYRLFWSIMRVTRPTVELLSISMMSAVVVCSRPLLPGIKVFHRELLVVNDDAAPVMRSQASTSCVFATSVWFSLSQNHTRLRWNSGIAGRTM